MADIDRVSDTLGIPWEHRKDIPFQNTITYIGFEWNIEAREVSIPQAKKQKYLSSITAWHAKGRYTLQDVQKLYGKLLHCCQIIPAGRAYLTNLEAMLGVYNNRPFMPRTPPRGTRGDLEWWTVLLANESVSRPIPGPIKLIELSAYSDASSSTGIGIIIRDRWRAWRLLPGWNTEQRDIGWAEGIGFEFLVRALLPTVVRGSHFIVDGDNNGIVEGWWNNRSRNPPTNFIFRDIHSITKEAGVTVHTRYVASADNPADGPSRGIYPPRANLLPYTPIPQHLQHLIVDFDAPAHPTELRLQREGRTASPLQKPKRENRQKYCDDFQQISEQIRTKFNAYRG